MTQIYAERDLTRAEEVMREIGLADGSEAVAALPDLPSKPKNAGEKFPLTSQAGEVRSRLKKLKKSQ